MDLLRSAGLENVSLSVHSFYLLVSSDVRSARLGGGARGARPTPRIELNTHPTLADHVLRAQLRHVPPGRDKEPRRGPLHVCGFLRGRRRVRLRRH